jgi:hypothetical protein
MVMLEINVAAPHGVINFDHIRLGTRSVAKPGIGLLGGVNLANSFQVRPRPLAPCPRCDAIPLALAFWLREGPRGFWGNNRKCVFLEARPQMAAH